MEQIELFFNQAYPIYQIAIPFVIGFLIFLIFVTFIRLLLSINTLAKELNKSLQPLEMAIERLERSELHQQEIDKNLFRWKLAIEKVTKYTKIYSQIKKFLPRKKKKS